MDNDAYQEKMKQRRKTMLELYVQLDEDGKRKFPQKRLGSRYHITVARISVLLQKAREENPDIKDLAIAG